MSRSLKIFQDDSATLDNISVASPCHASWTDMVGSETVRFCASCQKNVYNLSGLKRDEAIDLLRATEGRLCVRFFRRADGTVLTEDCPVGVALVLRRAKRATLAAAALSLGAVAALLAVLGGTVTKKACQRIHDVKTTIENVIPVINEPATMGAPPPMMGDVATPVPVPPVPTMGEAIAVPEMGKPMPPQEVKGKVSISKHMGHVRVTR